MCSQLTPILLTICLLIGGAIGGYLGLITEHGIAGLITLAGAVGDALAGRR